MPTIISRPQTEENKGQTSAFKIEQLDLYREPLFTTAETHDQEPSWKIVPG